MKHKQILWRSNNEFSQVGNMIYLLKENYDEVYMFEDIAVDIINIISRLKECSLEDLIKELNKNYELEETSKEEISLFLKDLKEEKIIETL